MADTAGRLSSQREGCKLERLAMIETVLLVNESHEVHKLRRTMLTMLSKKDPAHENEDNKPAVVRTGYWRGC